MNEEALKYSYELFKSDGYNGTIDEYKKLINSNEEAFNYSYELFKGDGYNGTIDDFGGLVKKKDQSASKAFSWDLWNTSKASNSSPDQNFSDPTVSKPDTKKKEKSLLDKFYDFATGAGDKQPVFERAAVTPIGAIQPVEAYRNANALTVAEVTEKERKEIEKRDNAILNSISENAFSQYTAEELANPEIQDMLFQDYLEQTGYAKGYKTDKEKSKYLAKEEYFKKNPSSKLNYDPLNKAETSKAIAEAHDVPEEVWYNNPDNEVELGLHEMRLNFIAQLTKQKADQLKSKEQVTGKLNLLENKASQLEELSKQIEKDPSDNNKIETYNAIAAQFNEELQDEDVVEYIKVNSMHSTLIDQAKQLENTFPNSLKTRLDKFQRQQDINMMFEFEKRTGLKSLSPTAGGAPMSWGTNSIGRSIIGFASGIAKLPTLLDWDNEYGKTDAYGDMIDEYTESINENLFPIADQINQPLFYDDENGKKVFRSDLLLPKVIQTGSDMAMLLYGANKISKGLQLMKGLTKGSDAINKASLMGSTFIQTFDDYYNENIGTGKMTPNEAKLLAITQSSLEGAIETFNPQAFLFSKATRQMAAKETIKHVLAGKSKLEAAKLGAQFLTKQIAGEEFEEILQSSKDFLAHTFVNYATNKDVFDTDLKDFENELLEVAVITPIISGLPAAPKAAGHVVARNALYKDAIKMVAADTKKYMPALKKAMVESYISPEDANQILFDINTESKKITGGESYWVGDQQVEKEEIVKRIEEGKLDGIEIYGDEKTSQLAADKQSELTLAAQAGKPLKQEKKAKRVAKGDKPIEGDLVTFETDQDGNFNVDESKITSLNPKSATPEKAKKLGKIVSHAKNVLRNIVPDLKVVMYNGDEAGQRIFNSLGVKEKSSHHGFYHAKSKTIYLNLPDLRGDTPFHEAIHPIMNVVKEVAPEKFKALSEQAATFKIQLEDGTEVSYLDRNNGDYEEALVEFLGDFAANKFDQSLVGKLKSDGALKVIKDLLVQLAEYLGVPVSDFNINIDKVNDVKSFAGSIADTFKKGKAVNILKKSPESKSRPAKETQSSEKKTGKAFSKFFSDVSSGRSGYSTTKYMPVIDLEKRGEDVAAFVNEYVNHRGNFDDHIAKSIPSFKETQVITGAAIASVYGDEGADLLDIGGSDNSWAKTISKVSGGKIKTTTLDPNPDMKKHSDKISKVKGNEYVPHAYMSGWKEDDGTVIPTWEPKKKYDIVHEAMTFQFISNERDSQIKYMKDNVLKDDGVVMLEEKLFNEDWTKNEKIKDSYKSMYFTGEELAKKKREILQGKGDKVEGMESNMISENDFDQILGKHFKYVEKYWDAGNFKGYIASDNKSKVNEILSKIGNIIDHDKEVLDLIERHDNERAENRKKVSKAVEKELNRLKSIDKSKEDGMTVNMDGSLYEGDGFVVPLMSNNYNLDNLDTQGVNDLISVATDLNDDSVKLGVFKFKGSKMASVDINLELFNEDVAVKFARLAGQNSVWDNGNKKLIETGNKGDNPVRFNPSELKKITGALSRGIVPDFINKDVQSSKKRTLVNEDLNNVAEEYKAYAESLAPQVSEDGVFSQNDIDSLANLHETIKDDRNNPEVIASYEAFMDETMAMYNLLIDAGYTIEPYMEEGEPYGVNSSLVRKDLKENKHLSYLRSRSNTGEEGNESVSPEEYILFRPTGVVTNGDEMLYNDAFRAVHDIFGHGVYNNSFSTQGEYKAYLTHSNMYSPKAQMALFLETVVYNAYYAKNGRYAPRKMYPIHQEIIDRIRSGSQDTQASLKKASDKSKENNAEYKKLKSKLAEAGETVDVFLNNFWPKMLRSVGMRLTPNKKNYSKALQKTIPDFIDWLKTNPQYIDYYHKDWDLTRSIVDDAFGGNVSDDDFVGFRIISGLTSPSTKLPDNLSDTVKMFDLFLKNRSFSGMSVMENPSTGSTMADPKNLFTLSSTTGAIKIRSLNNVHTLYENIGTWQGVLDYLKEPVPVNELQEFNKSLGYKSRISDIGAIKNVVQEATGQSDLIPRMFVFGKKVGAYTLNMTGDHRFTTTDIWESRFIRSHFPEMFKSGTGLPVNVSEVKIFQGFATEFNKEIEKRLGLNLEPSAYQAARWFYILDLLRNAGYEYAQTNNTVSEYTRQAVERISRGAASKNNQGSGRGSDKNSQKESEGSEVNPSQKKSGPKKVLNKTAKRIALDNNTVYKEIQKEVLTNPQRYSYTPQDLLDKKMDLRIASDEELVKNTASVDKLLAAIDFDNNFAVLAAIEAINRLSEAGLDTRPAFDKLHRLGRGIGQLLRQFAELKSGTADGIINTVVENLANVGHKLTDEQADQLQILARDFIKSKDQETKAFEAHDSDPTDKNWESLNKAIENRDKKFDELAKFVSDVTPMGVDKMIATILQGNLLKLTSIGANIAGNVLFMPTRQIELMGGDIGYWIYSKLAGIHSAGPLTTFGASWEGAKSTAKSLPSVIKNAFTGKTESNEKTFDVRRGLHPFTALWQIFTPQGRKMLPAKLKGRSLDLTSFGLGKVKVPNPRVGLHIEKMLEGTAGMNAELMFRLLYVGDAPFKAGARAAAAYRLYQRSGAKGSFEEFYKKMNDSQKLYAETRALEATFSDDRTLSTIADKGVSTARNIIQWLADRVMPKGLMRDSFNVIANVILKANVPYVRVPANLVQYMIELTMPVIPMLAGLRYMKSNPEKGSQLITRGILGFGFLYLADALIEAGAVVAGSDGDDEEERQYKYESTGANTINVDAVQRLIAGIHDPENPVKTGDRYVEYSKLGPLGVALVARAKLKEKVKQGTSKKQPKDYNELAFYEKSIEMLNAASRSTMELSFLQGTSEMIKALKDDGLDSYFANLGNTMMAIPLPNNATATTMARRDVMLRARDKNNVINDFIEKQSVKWYPNQKDNVDGVYPVISMWGKPVEQNKKESAYGEINPFVRQYFDITRSGKITDPLTVEMWNLSQRTNEFPITAPSSSRKLYPSSEAEEAVSVSLSEVDFVEAQIIAGELKRMDIMDLVNDPDYATMTDAEKIEEIKAINSNANSDALDYVTDRIQDMIDNEKIIVDEKSKSYRYLQVNRYEYNKLVDNFRTEFGLN